MNRAKTAIFKIFIGVLIAIMFLTTSMRESLIADDPFSNIKDKLNTISKEEKDILQNLFIMVQEIEELEKEEKDLGEEIVKTNQDIDALQRAIEYEKKSYIKKQESLKQLLKSYQRMGPGSYLEIILNSDNLSDFIRRINVLRDITRNTGELLDQIELSLKKQEENKVALSQKLLTMKKKQNLLEESLVKKKKLRTEKETYLSSLGEERDFYQDYLSNIEVLWADLKKYFADSMKEFSTIIQEGVTGTDSIQITYNFLNIKGSISEKSINNIIEKNTKPPHMIFDFNKGKVNMVIQEKNLKLSGTFYIEKGDTLKFKVENGSFYDLPLETGAIEELLMEDFLKLNLKPALGSFIVSSIEITDDSLELNVVPKLMNK